MKTPKDGPYESFYENGQLKIKGTYKDGKPDGPFESYFENGQLKQKGVCKEGKLDGVCESYNRDGRLQFRATYKLGKLRKAIDWGDRSAGPDESPMQGEGTQIE